LGRLPRFNSGSANGRDRRVSPVAVCPREGLLTEPTAIKHQVVSRDDDGRPQGLSRRPSLFRRDRWFESGSLQRRVRLSTGISLARSRSWAFRANVRAMPGDGVGRDRYGRATSHHWRRMSLLGQISVPRGRRWIEADRGVLPATGGFQPKSDGSSYSAIALRTKSTRSDTPILGTVQTS
jgi:hypothetical protein